MSDQQTCPFIYKWIHIPSGMWYIGSRTAKGCHPNDGYVCSSLVVEPMIVESPADWKREILEVGHDSGIIRKRETAILQLLNAKKDPMSFNKCNADGFFTWTTEGTICINNGTVERFIKQDQLAYFIAGDWVIGRADSNKKQIGETVSKLRAKNPDNWPPRRGKENNRSTNWRLISPAGEIFEFCGGLNEVCDSKGISANTIKKAVREGWRPRRGLCAGWQAFNLDENIGTTRDTLNHSESHSGQNNPWYKQKLKG